MKKSVNKPYWASVGTSEIADNILEKVDDYYEYLTSSGRLDLWRRSWAYYYRPRLMAGMINPAGQQGELSTVSVNDFRNYLVHLETMTTQQKPAFEPKATNSDAQSQAQVILASGLLDYYQGEKKLDRNFKLAVKQGLIFSEGFIRVEWDATSGEVYGQTPTGAPAYEGDLKYTNYNPLDVIRDFTKQVNSHKDWAVLRDFPNKYDLAAKFPELEEKILSDTTDYLRIWRTTSLNYFNLDESDNIAVYTLLHPPTPAMPNGRYTQVLDNGTVLMDGPLPYEKTHVYRLAPDEETGTIFGYTVAFDLLPIQEMTDIVYSTITTNISTFGVQNITAPKGSDLSVSQLTGGLNFIEYNSKEGKPEPLNLLATPAEVYGYLDRLKQAGQTVSGVNSVVRGDPEASLKSGSALALVQAQAIQFSMNLQQSYAMVVEDVGTGTIEILQAFAAVPRVAEITGKANRPLMKEFTGKDLDAIKRVTVDLGNPMTKTIAGRENLANSYFEKGLIENTDQYMQVVNTGRMEPVIQSKQSNNILMKGENELLAEGQPQRALITDNHVKHIMEHAIVLANPDIRQDPNNPIVQATLAHIQEHIDMMNNPGAQQLLMILHQEIVQNPMAGMMPPPGAPAPDGSAGGASPAAMLDATNPVTQEAAQVNQPNMPSAPPGTEPQSAQIIEGQQ